METTEDIKNKLSESKIVRNIEGNKLVIDCGTMNYKLRMLESNKIPGLLPLEITENDGIKKLCYDITSREAFGSLGAMRTLKMEDVRNLLYSLNHILKNLDNYLLDPDDLVLDKDFIYVRNDNLDPRLCYLPGYNSDFSVGLSVLLQDVLGMVDHNDHDAVVLAYSVYQESLKPGYVMADLIKILNSENSTKRADANKDKDKEADANKEKREKTTDELFVEYQIPAMEQAARLGAKPGNEGSKPTSGKKAEDMNALSNAVSKTNRHKHSTIFSR